MPTVAKYGASIGKWIRNALRQRPRDAIEKTWINDDPTFGYRPTMRLQAETIIDELPFFRLQTARLMLRDPVIRIGLTCRNAALSAAQIQVECKDARVREWIGKQWQFLWNHYRTALLRAKVYGHSGLQLELERNRDTNTINICGLKEFAPEDVRPLSYGGRVAAFRVRSAANSPVLLPPRGVWLSFDDDAGQPGGASILKRSYSPWWEKHMPGGAVKTRQLRLIKDAYIGDVLQFPWAESVDDAEGNPIPWRDIVRSISEARLAGATIVIPRKMDAEGNEQITYTPPQDTGTPTGIYQWVDDLDRDIWRGLDVFEEVIQAADTGSGFSGRSVPLTMFLAGCGEELTQIVKCLDEFTFAPLVYWNFGPNIEYDITVVPLVKTFSQDMSGSPMGGEAMGGQAGSRPPGGNPPGQQPPPQNQPAYPRSPKPKQGGPSKGPTQFTEPLEGDGLPTIDYDTSDAIASRTVAALRQAMAIHPGDIAREVRRQRTTSKRLKGQAALRAVFSAIPLILARKQRIAQDIAEDGLLMASVAGAAAAQATIEREAEIIQGAAALAPLPADDGTLETVLVTPETVPATVTPPLEDRPTITLKPVTQPEAPKPPSGRVPSTESLFGRRKRVRFPNEIRARKKLRDSVALAGQDYRETARMVREDAFAITTRMGDDVVSHIRDALKKNMNEGMDLKGFIEQVQKIQRGQEYPLSRARIELVFRANTARYLSDAADAALRNPLVADQFPYRAYSATHDDRVRDEHLRLEQTGLNGTNVYRGDDPAWQAFRPPWAFNSVLPGTVIHGDVLFATKMLYSGEVYKLTTKSGRTCTVTSNHPVLTKNGFVPAYMLANGIDLLGYNDSIEDAATAPFGDSLSSVNNDIQHGPAVIDNVFESFRSRLHSVVVNTSVDDFHGDAVFTNGNVEIVACDRELLNDLMAAIQQSGSHFVFPEPDLNAAIVSCARAFKQRSFGKLSSTHRLMESGQMGGRTASFVPQSCRIGTGSNLTPSRYQATADDAPTDTQSRGYVSNRIAASVSSTNIIDAHVASAVSLMPTGNTITDCPDRNSLLDQQVFNTSEIDAILFRELLQRFPGSVTVDQLVDIEILHYDGPVYDIQTTTGYMVAGGIIQSNCRCWWRPVSVRQAARIGVVEANNWLSRATTRANAEGGLADQYLARVKPASGEMVPWPTIDGKEFRPSPEWTRTGVQFGEVQRGLFGDEFDVESKPAKPQKKAKPESTERQGMLWTGLDLKPGQRDFLDEQGDAITKSTKKDDDLVEIRKRTWPEGGTPIPTKEDFESKHPRAPKGGATIKGEKYDGGEFIPAKTLEHLAKQAGPIGLRDLGEAVGMRPGPSHDPLKSPLNRALVTLTDQGLIQSHESKSGFGEPGISLTDKGREHVKKQAADRPRELGDDELSTREVKRAYERCLANPEEYSSRDLIRSAGYADRLSRHYRKNGDVATADSIEREAENFRRITKAREKGELFDADHQTEEELIARQVVEEKRSINDVAREMGLNDQEIRIARPAIAKAIELERELEDEGKELDTNPARKRAQELRKKTDSKASQEASKGDADNLQFREAAQSGWITLGGGASVFVSNGRILEGCPGLKGQDITDLIDESDASRAKRKKRQDKAESLGITGEEVSIDDLEKLDDGELPADDDSFDFGTTVTDPDAVEADPVDAFITQAHDYAIGLGYGPEVLGIDRDSASSAMSNGTPPEAFAQQRIDDWMAQFQPGQKTDKANRKIRKGTKLYRDIKESLAADDGSEANEDDVQYFGAVLLDVLSMRQEEAIQWNDTRRQMLYEMGLSDNMAAARIAREISRGKDATQLKRFDEIRKVLDGERGDRYRVLFRATQSESEGRDDTESLLMEALNSQQRKVPTLQDEEVWSEAFAATEYALSRAKTYDPDEEAWKSVEFSEPKHWALYYWDYRAECLQFAEQQMLLFDKKARPLWDEDEHPRATQGSRDPKYKGGRFVPKLSEKAQQQADRRKRESELRKKKNEAEKEGKIDTEDYKAAKEELDAITKAEGAAWREQWQLEKEETKKFAADPKNANVKAHETSMSKWVGVQLHKWLQEAEPDLKKLRDYKELINDFSSDRLSPEEIDKRYEKLKPILRKYRGENRKRGEYKLFDTIWELEDEIRHAQTGLDSADYAKIPMSGNRWTDESARLSFNWRKEVLEAHEAGHEIAEEALDAMRWDPQIPESLKTRYERNRAVKEARNTANDDIWDQRKTWAESILAAPVAKVKTEIEPFTSRVKAIKAKWEKKYDALDDHQQHVAIKEKLAELGNAIQAKGAMEDDDPLAIEWKNTSEELAKSYNRIWEARRDIESQASEEFRNEFIKSFAPQQKAVVSVGENQISDAEFNQRLKKVTGFIGQITGRDAVESLKINVKQMAEGETRASCGGDTINVSAVTNESTIAHEIGHAIEHADDSRIAEISRGYLANRVSSDPHGPQHMGDHYDDHEVGWDDKFQNRYIGKLYHYATTEILSMGVQYLYENALEFSQKDPDHFAYTVAALRGDL